MSAQTVRLERYPGKPWVRVRDLCGHDEQAVGGADTLTALQLLDRLFVEAPGAPVPVQAAKLTAADRDRLLVEIYVRVYGPRVESTVDCAACGEPFDLAFSLPELLDSLWQDVERAQIDVNPEGTYGLPDGRRYRLPTGEDEGAIWGLSPEAAQRELLARCVVEGDPTVDPDAVQQAMREIAPVLDLDLDAGCPECGASQPVHFDLQSYLFSALMAERQQFTYQVHLLAAAYGWSLGEILRLTRSDRQTYAALIEAERSVAKGT